MVPALSSKVAHFTILVGWAIAIWGEKRTRASVTAMITTQYGNKHLETVDGGDSYIPYDQCPQADKCIAELWQDNSVYVIVEAPTGRFYTNQTHGMACHHPIAEGILVKLGDFDMPHVGCWGRLFKEDCDMLDAVITRYGISVDRYAALSPQHSKRVWGEAWVPVIGSMEGVLTYPNCD